MLLEEINPSTCVLVELWPHLLPLTLPLSTPVTLASPSFWKSSVILLPPGLAFAIPSAWGAVSPGVFMTHSPCPSRWLFKGHCISHLRACSPVTLFSCDILQGSWPPPPTHTMGSVSQAPLSGAYCWVRPLRSMRGIWTDGWGKPFSSPLCASGSVLVADASPLWPQVTLGKNHSQALVTSLA